eukprot:Gregarina_sp_Poly_1__4080@NODE_223_length_11242_cov_216_496107_g197_i0_p13_GENE_NODE_223_length_11242_cov_216_496107_g197_i0NODE_223_length_11242_cov_216_496107_g197_i0_p13_ORF_typecomplete_len129_score10_55DUF3136/PF11334_8/0_055_NODE_223_length_11242_cov_216_496107_g197_i053035689
MNGGDKKRKRRLERRQRLDAGTRCAVSRCYRRIACWRSLKTLHSSLGGEIVREDCYVNLKGYVIPKPGAYSVAQREKQLLSRLNVATTGPGSSLGDKWDAVKIFSNAHTLDAKRFSLDFWSVPEAVVK